MSKARALMMAGVSAGNSDTVQELRRGSARTGPHGGNTLRADVNPAALLRRALPCKDDSRSVAIDARVRTCARPEGGHGARLIPVIASVRLTRYLPLMTPPLHPAREAPEQ